MSEMGGFLSHLERERLGTAIAEPWVDVTRIRRTLCLQKTVVSFRKMQGGEFLDTIQFRMTFEKKSSKLLEIGDSWRVLIPASRCADAKGDRDRLERELRDHKETI